LSAFGNTTSIFHGIGPSLGLLERYLVSHLPFFAHSSPADSSILFLPTDFHRLTRALIVFFKIGDFPSYVDIPSLFLRDSPYFSSVSVFSFPGHFLMKSAGLGRLFL